jgi:methylmalonyl-CoA/ethylmalonyl-CoA epimerase
MITKIHHLGIVVRNLDKAIQFFEETYGAKLLFRRKFEEQRTESALVSIGEAKFELSTSHDRQSVIGRFIESQGEGIHHVSLEVDDFSLAIEKIKGKGLEVISEADLGDFKAAFVHPKGNLGVLTEIIQPK